MKRERGCAVRKERIVLYRTETCRLVNIHDDLSPSFSLHVINCASTIATDCCLCAIVHYCMECFSAIYDIDVGESASFFVHRFVWKTIVNVWLLFWSWRATVDCAEFKTNGNEREQTKSYKTKQRAMDKMMAHCYWQKASRIISFQHVVKPAWQPAIENWFVPIASSSQYSRWSHVRWLRVGS